MKNQLIAATIISAAALLWLGGCSMSPTAKLSDGTAGDITMEFAQMSSESSAGLAKTAGEQAELADTVAYSGEFIIQKWTYDPASTWWTRRFEDTLLDGRVFVSSDSLQFADAASQAKTTMPAWVTSTGWKHIRNVTRSGFVNTFSSRFEMNVAVAKSATDTSATWNGTISGTWNGALLAARNDTVTNVVRTYADVGGVHWWRFPSSGTINIDNPLRTWVITFLGNGGVTAKVTRLSDGKTKIFTITISTGKEDE